MAIKIIIIPDNKVIMYELRGSKVKVLKILEFLAKTEGTSLNAYVVMRKGKVIARDDELLDGEEIEVYRVVSGG